MWVRFFLANTRHGLMLGHRLRRWPNIKPTLGERLVPAGLLVFADPDEQPIKKMTATRWPPPATCRVFWPVSSKHETLTQGYVNVRPASQTMCQHWPGIGVTSDVWWVVPWTTCRWRHRAGVISTHDRAPLSGVRVWSMANHTHIEPMLAYCWASVGDGGPTINHHWITVVNGSVLPTLSQH